MKRTFFALLVLGGLVAPMVDCGSSGPPAVTIGSTPGQAVPATFMGFSHEWGVSRSMMGDSKTGVDTIYRQLLKNLTAYGSGPIVLRIVCGSTDCAQEPTSTTARPLAELASAQGVHFYLGVKLGSTNLNLATDQARAYVSQMPSGSVNAIEIGNEPDMAPDYAFNNYLTTFDTWKANILPVLPSSTRLMAPSWALPGQLSHTEPFISSEAQALTVFSQHYYVAGYTADSPGDLLLHSGSARDGAGAVADAVGSTHQSGVPFRMGEINSISGGGKSGISDTFQSALWAIDTMFNYVNVGVDGVNWHSGNNNAYDAFRIDVQTSGGKATYSLESVRPLYYGLLFFQAATGNGARLLPLGENLNSSISSWATVDASGVTRLVLINKDKTNPRTVRVTVNGYAHARIYRLIAPSYQSTSGITFAGQTFDGSTDGTIRGTQAVDKVDATAGIFEIPVPAVSAALIVFEK